ELRRLLADYPDTVWKSQAAFRAGALARAAGDFDEAHGWLETARAGLSAGSDRAAWATMALAEMAHRANDDVAALDLARAVRHSRPHTLADRRARRPPQPPRRARPGGRRAVAVERRRGREGAPAVPRHGPSLPGQHRGARGALRDRADPPGSGPLRRGPRRVRRGRDPLPSRAARGGRPLARRVG